jgi:predicted Abi (CAAX) family protease
MVNDRVAAPPKPASANPSNYDGYWQATFNQPATYPIHQKVDPALYRPIGEWMGRLILPRRDEREAVMGALMEVYHSDEAHQELVGKIVRLRWHDDIETNSRFWGITRPVFFDANSRKVAMGGNIVPDRLDQRTQVNPFESLAGARPHDDMVVRLHGPIKVEMPAPGSNGDEEWPIVYTPRIPVQICGRYYALIRFVGPTAAGSDLYRVRHYNVQSGAFDGIEEVVRLPEVRPDNDGIMPATRTDIEKSPINELGWYIFGNSEADGTFCILGYAPRKLIRCKPMEVIKGAEESKLFLKPSGWKNVVVNGDVHTALLCPDGNDDKACLDMWREGDNLLLVHVYGGIGGPKGEAAARTPVYWGHFAFGIATIVHEPLANELVFDIEYLQVYAHNPDGLIAGTLHWSRYAGDRQFGWVGVRPIQDVIIKLDAFTDEFDFGKLKRSGLMQTVLALELMCSRYRIADGRGGTSISASNNCAQDSSQALYAAIRDIERGLTGRSDVQEWKRTNPKEAERVDRLLALGEKLRKTLLPFGSARADWEWGMATIGSSLAANPIENLGMALRSWRTILPSVAARSIVQVFLDEGASAWVLRSHQVGGVNPNIAPRIPSV